MVGQRQVEIEGSQLCNYPELSLDRNGTLRLVTSSLAQRLRWVVWLAQAALHVERGYVLVPVTSTIGTLDPIGHGHSIASNILAASVNPVLSCKHSGESPFQLSWDLWK